MTTLPPNGSNGTARWQLWFSAASVGIALLGALLVLTWRVNSAYEGMRGLETRLANIENVARQNRTNVQVLEAHQREIETQIATLSTIRDLDRYYQERMNALLWQKTFVQSYPTFNIPYPAVANRQPRLDAGP